MVRSQKRWALNSFFFRSLFTCLVPTTFRTVGIFQVVRKLASPLRLHEIRTRISLRDRVMCQGVRYPLTFPLRSDTWIATDLSQRDIDTVPSPNIPPPALPYPALAGFPTSTAVMGSQTSHGSPLSLTTGSKATGGFFFRSRKKLLHEEGRHHLRTGSASTATELSHLRRRRHRRRTRD